VAARYDEQADCYFWLRQPPDGSDVDELRARVQSIYAGLPPVAFLLLDPAVAGEPNGTQAVLNAIPHLPKVISGIPISASLEGLARALDEAPSPPAARKALVDNAVAQLDLPAVERAVEWAATALGFDRLESLAIEVFVVAQGVPLGGLTGGRLDERPICFVNVVGQEGSTFAEAVIHEALHAVDMSSVSERSLVQRLRDEETTMPQLWHVPMFVAAAEATRRFISPDHLDLGDTHGYYAKVPREIEELDARGVLVELRRR
jgi:hypothetical protein